MSYIVQLTTKIMCKIIWVIEFFSFWFFINDFDVNAIEYEKA